MAARAEMALRTEDVVLAPDATDGEPRITLRFITDARHDGLRRPVILVLGAPEEPPFWSRGLLADGYALVGISVAREPDPDPARRPVFLHFDERFAHSYALGGQQAVGDVARVIDYLETRSDVNAEKIGWLGSSSSAIPGLAAAVREPRLAAFVGFVATGAYRSWFETWHTHGLWRGVTADIWPETDELLTTCDPVLGATGLWPTATLLVSGGDDTVVDPATTEEFVAAARLAYVADPARLRHVVYTGMGHNLPADVVLTHAEAWFRLYLHPTDPAPTSEPAPQSLTESVAATQVTGVEHSALVGAEVETA
jgi:hypothetical protein